MSLANDTSQETYLRIQLSWSSVRPGFASCTTHELQRKGWAVELQHLSISRNQTSLRILLPSSSVLMLDLSVLTIPRPSFSAFSGR